MLRIKVNTYSDFPTGVKLADTDPDLSQHQNGKSDPDRHQKYVDPQHWLLKLY
jgi:hypothetical protein